MTLLLALLSTVDQNGVTTSGTGFDPVITLGSVLLMASIFIAAIGVTITIGLAFAAHGRQLNRQRDIDNQRYIDQRKEDQAQYLSWHVENVERLTRVETKIDDVHAIRDLVSGISTRLAALERNAASR
jgi:hypothetical protein